MHWSQYCLKTTPFTFYPVLTVFGPSVLHLTKGSRKSLQQNNEAYSLVVFVQIQKTQRLLFVTVCSTSSNSARGRALTMANREKAFILCRRHGWHMTSELMLQALLLILYIFQGVFSAWSGQRKFDYWNEAYEAYTHRPSGFHVKHIMGHMVNKTLCVRH